MKLPIGLDASRCRMSAVYVVGALVVVVLWANVIGRFYAGAGLFRTVGSDWSGYYAQALAVLDGHGATMYDLSVIGRYEQRLAGYSLNSDAPMLPVPVPYPPLFAWLIASFTVSPPPVGFGLWVALNGLLAVYLARRVSKTFPPSARPSVYLLLLASFPVVRQWINGQVGILIAIMCTEFCLSLRAGKDFRAGAWLGCLLMKPQLAILVVPVLVLKRRWRTIGGASASAGVIAAGSLLVAGLPGLVGYLAAAAQQGGMHGLLTTAPEVMVNWRALVLFVKPDIGDRTGLLVVGVLGLLTSAALVPAWRGPWCPRHTSFGTSLSLLFVATLIVTLHSHADYVTILATPLALVFTETHSRLTRAAILTLAVLPTLTELIAGLLPPIIFAGGDWLGAAIPFPPLYPALLLLCYGALLADLLARRSRSVVADRMPVPSPIW